MPTEKYAFEVSHEGLHKYRVIRGTDYDEVQRRARALEAQWTEEWKRKKEKMERDEKKEKGLDNAASTTREAQEALVDIDNLLANSLATKVHFSLKMFYNTASFGVPKPRAPKLESLPIEPQRSWEAYKPKRNFMTIIFSSAKATAEVRAEQRFLHDHATWEEDINKVREVNMKIEEKHKKEIAAWELQKKEFEATQKKQNEEINKLEQEYAAMETSAVVDYCELVLTHSKYPEYFPDSFEISYSPETKILIVEYELPSPDQMPTLKEVKYIASKNEYKNSYISEAEKKKMYDSVIYRISLRILHELFSSDKVNAIEAIALNGNVNTIDKATGQSINPCILSIVVEKEDFTCLNLANVDVKDCFKKLKGVAGSSLYNIAAITPLIQFDKHDKRIIEGRNVIGDIDNTQNLAAMDWQDFEHLVREILEKEFSSNQGEVKVTRSSRDEGVDAIAFDPDPIRGGKIVVQAKRYTNTVGVSAVRDLYGTTLNEGATKGILITTSDFGPDSYDFAKGKPITLLNGNNLLFLLEKHGTKARIDIAEAKKMAKDG